MSKTLPQYQELKQIYAILQQNITTNRNKNEYQKLIYRQIIRTFHIFSKQLQTISSKINQQILKTSGNILKQLQIFCLESYNNNDQYQNNTYQYLSNSLLRLGQCSRKVASKCKNQILDPFDLFSMNYFQLSNQQLKKTQQHIHHLKLHIQEIQKQRENYRLANKKLEFSKEQQTKMIVKIENNYVKDNLTSQNQITKFNLNIKKIIQNITSFQKFYIGSIQKANYQWIQTKQQLQKTFKFLAYNQESRNSFCRKSAISCIKSLEEFHFAVDSQVQKKIQDSSKQLNTQKYQSQAQKKLKLKIHTLVSSKIEQEYISYQDQVKSLKKQFLVSQQSHLSELFNKVKQMDKNYLKKWLDQFWVEENEKNNQKQKQINQSQKSTNNQIDKQKQNDYLISKILKDIPFTFYFIQLLYFKIIQMNSIYLKLQQVKFHFICQIFNLIINGLDLQKSIQLNIEFIYKILLISQRLMKKRNKSSENSKSNLNLKSQPIQLGCHFLSKNIHKLKNPNVLKKILAYIQKKRQDKKKQGKSMINNITKGFFAAVTGKKDPILNQEQQFICLQQFANIMSNLSIPTEISLPLIKQYLGSQNQSSFEYLKSIILSKKDTAQRQKIFYKKEIKGKIQKQIESIIKNKQIEAYCILLAVKKGYLGLESIRIRQVCKYLSLAHQQILHRMKIPTTVKWPKIVPFDRKFNFRKLIEQSQQQKNISIDQIIGLDVNRSLHIHIDYLKPQILTLILKLYAYSHKQIAYCQGMNYIAGYVFIKTKNQQASYRLFEYLMQNRFKQLFANEFQILKIKMYQFQRLLAIYHPQISQHFKRQSIVPECYIISWIITLFASSYQYTMQSYLIDLLWQRFIIWGWKQFFKFVLWLFSIYKEQIIQMTYDKALHFFGDLVKSSLFLSARDKFFEQHSKLVGNINQGIEKFHVSDQLLEDLKKEYHIN